MNQPYFRAVLGCSCVNRTVLGVISDQPIRSADTSDKHKAPRLIGLYCEKNAPRKKKDTEHFWSKIGPDQQQVPNPFSTIENTYSHSVLEIRIDETFHRRPLHTLRGRAAQGGTGRGGAGRGGAGQEYHRLWPATTIFWMKRPQWKLIRKAGKGGEGTHVKISNWPGWDRKGREGKAREGNLGIGTVLRALTAVGR